MPIWTVIRTINTPPGSPLAIHESILGDDLDVFRLVHRRWLENPNAAEPSHIQIARGGDKRLVRYSTALTLGALLRQ